MTAGRPNLMTTRNVQAITSRLAQGATIASAAAACDPPLHPGTLHGWIKRGETEATRLEILGHNPDEIDLQDPTINAQERQYFAFARAVAIAQAVGPGELLAVLWQAATEGLETVETRTTRATDPDTGLTKEGPTQVTTRRQRDVKAAMWLMERLDPDTWHLPTRVELTGAGGEPIRIAGFTDRQSEAFAVFVRALLDEIVALVPPRSRPKLEKAIPDALDVALRAIEPAEPAAP